MWEKVISSVVEFVAGRAIGGAIGIPALAVKGICTVASSAIDNTARNTKKSKSNSGREAPFP